MTDARETFDVVVVGSGSAGGTLAARLSEDPGCHVLLLEAGPDFPDEARHPPAFLTGGAVAGARGAGAGAPVPEYDWGYESEELPGGRRVPLWRGRMVGGTSMINGSVAVRPRPADLQRWVACGATGWEWDRVRGLFQTVERELAVSTYPRELWLPVQRLMLDGFRQLGFRNEEDLNAPDAWDGVVGPWPRSRRNELRLGTLNTYLRAARGRPNLTLRARALVDRVDLRGGRATGVTYVDATGAPRHVDAGHVVLSAGAYGSPPILLRSGIGPAEELRELGIVPVADLPVGRHLMDHPALPFVLRVDREHARMGWPSLAAVARGRGWWAIPLPYDGERGLVQLTFCLATVDGPGHGSVRLRSVRPDAAPVIDHDYAAAISDGSFDGVWEDFGRLLETPALRAADATDPRAGDTLRERLERRITTGTHPAGGCDIGTVVDADLAVHGVDGLTVADASVFPRHVTNNPNLTCFVVGEAAAQRLRGVTPAERPPARAPASGAARSS